MILYNSENSVHDIRTFCILKTFWQLSGWQLSRVAIILGFNCRRWQLFGGSCPVGCSLDTLSTNTELTNNSNIFFHYS